jgi:aspartate aminotransferase-like enzyme
MSTTLPSQSPAAQSALPQAPEPLNLRLPGPTPVPPEVAAAGAWPVINHRGPEFLQIIERVTGNLQHFFQTAHDVVVFPGSGSAGWEASVANLFSPGDQVAVISIGNFGERFSLVANAFGLKVEKIAFEWGQAADPEVVGEKLRAISDLRAILVTHNETSTGVTNDLAALVQVFHTVAPDALIIVDAVSSLGCIDLPMDDLGVDVVFTGSQKGWMCPPGLMMIGIGPRALAATKNATLPRFYWDFNRALSSFKNGGPPYTAPLSLWYQLDVALVMMRNEGREAIFARHAAVGDYVRTRSQEMGLSIFADLAHASNTVTAINAQPGMDVKRFLATLRNEERVELQGGQDHLTGKIFRIGHLGAVQIADVAAALDAVERHLNK